MPLHLLHHDMYPSHAGVVLPEHYTTREAVEALLALCDLSALGCSLAECEVLPRQGRGTPQADAVERPLGSRPRGVRPLLGELLLSLHGRRVVLLRRRRLDARRRLAGIDVSIFKPPPGVFPCFLLTGRGLFCA